MRDSKGFTLIELLIVVVIIGILAAIAIPRFSATRERAYFAAMKSDLKNLATQEEIYYAENYQYETALDALGFVESEGVTVNVASADGVGWGATADHTALDAEGCAIYYGEATHAVATPGGNTPTESGSIICDDAF